MQSLGWDSLVHGLVFINLLKSSLYASNLRRYSTSFKRKSNIAHYRYAVVQTSRSAIASTLRPISVSLALRQQVWTSVPCGHCALLRHIPQQAIAPDVYYSQSLPIHSGVDWRATGWRCVSTVNCWLTAGNLNHSVVIGYVGLQATTGVPIFLDIPYKVDWSAPLRSEKKMQRRNLALKYYSYCRNKYNN